MASYKTKVKEYFDKATESQPPYITKWVSGESHMPTFESIIQYKSKKFVGKGSSIKKAEEDAAKLLYEYIFQRSSPSIKRPPAISTPQPGVSTSQPVVSKPQPVVSTPQSVVSKPQPIVSKPQPVVSKPQPAVPKSQPVVPTPQSVIPVYQPVASLQQKQTLKIPPKRTIVKKRVVAVDVENKQTFIDSYSDFLADFEVYAFVGSRHCLADKEFPDFVNKILVDSTRKDAVDTAIQMYMGIWLALEKSDVYYIVTGDHFAGNLEDIAKNPPNDMWKPATVIQVTLLQHIK